MSLKNESKDILIYLTIAVTIVGGLLLYMFLVPPQRWIRVDIRWYGLAGATAVSFGYPIRAIIRLKLSKRRIVWLSLVLMLLVHLAFFILVLRSVDRVPLIYFGILPAIEIPMISAVISWIVEKFSNAKSSTTRPAT